MRAKEKYGENDPARCLEHGVCLQIALDRLVADRVRIIDLYGMRFEVFAKMSQDDASEPRTSEPSMSTAIGREYLRG